MNYSNMIAEASSVIDIRAALIAAGAALLAGCVIILIRHRKPNETK